MGDAADDVWDSMWRDIATIDRMRAVGCKPCPMCVPNSKDVCPLCKDLGWIDKEGKPCEP